MRTWDRNAPTTRQNAAGEWRCGACGAHKPIEQFNLAHARAGRYPLAYCKPCKAAKGRARRAANPQRRAQHTYFPPIGGRHWNAKLTDDDVRLIKGLLADLPAAVIARKFACSPSTIMGIKHGRCWTHVGHGAP